MTEPCRECAFVRGASAAELARHDGYVLHGILGGGALPGWLVLAPARHVERLEDLDADALARLGPLLARVTAALREVTGAEKVYVSLFAEALPHLHFHLVARTPEVPAELRGARAFLAAEKSDAAEARRVFERVRAVLGFAAP